MNEMLPINPVEFPGPYLNTLFPNYADLVTEKVRVPARLRYLRRRWEMR